MMLRAWRRASQIGCEALTHAGATQPGWGTSRKYSAAVENVDAVVVGAGECFNLRMYEGHLEGASGRNCTSKEGPYNSPTTLYLPGWEHHPCVWYCLETFTKAIGLKNKEARHSSRNPCVGCNIHCKIKQEQWDEPSWWISLV